LAFKQQYWGSFALLFFLLCALCGSAVDFSSSGASRLTLKKAKGKSTQAKGREGFSGDNLCGAE
jgi:hypothetical protein